MLLNQLGQRSHVVVTLPELVIKHEPASVKNLTRIKALTMKRNESKEEKVVPEGHLKRINRIGAKENAHCVDDANVRID